jgi:hypothetical protein
LYSSQGQDRPSLMDPFNDINTTPDQAMQNLLSTFKSHYDGNKAPFGLYIHPHWLSSDTKIPGNPATGLEKLIAMNKFLSLAMNFENTWMVTTSQLVAYMKNPVSALELVNQPYMKCRAPAPGICNGGPSSTGVQTCNFPSGAMRVSFFVLT